jgi:hypothetical protein
MTNIIIPNREAWLNEIARGLIQPIEDLSKKKMPNFRVSMGFPSKRALSTKSRRIGECWPGKASTDGAFEIMVSPVIDDEVRIAGIVAHELIHACVGTEHGHKKPFAEVAWGLGLTGKATATEEGPRFIELINPVIQTVGFKLPHSSLNPSSGGTHYKKQETRLLKVSCIHCNYTCRVTKKWLDIGAPICPTHNSVMRRPFVENEED